MQPLSRESVKIATRKRRRERQNKDLSQEPTERQRPQAQTWKRLGAAAPEASPRRRTTCGPPEPYSKRINSTVLSEPHAEGRKKRKIERLRQRQENNPPQSQEKSPQSSKRRIEDRRTKTNKKGKPPKPDLHT